MVIRSETEVTNLGGGLDFYAAIVTAVLPDGTILYTQQGEHMLNGSLTSRAQHIAEGEGNFSATFVRPRKNW